MSYFSDHLAWQQRVAQEFKAQSQFLEKNIVYPMGQESIYSGLTDVYNYVNASAKQGTDMKNGVFIYGGPRNVQNLSDIAPGTVPAMNDGDPMYQNALGSMSGIVTKKDLLRERSSTAKTGMRGKKTVAQNPYGYKPRSMVGAKRSLTTAKANQRQQVKEQVPNTEFQVPRFNEEIDTKSMRKSVGGGPKSIISGQSKNQVRPQSGFPAMTSESFKAQHQTLQQQQNKQKILEAVDKLSEKELERFGKILSLEEKEREYQQNNEGQEEGVEMEFDRQDEDNVSRITKNTRISGMAKSDISKLSNKTYISHLEKQLNEEREARKHLETELEELKRISSEISSHLGLPNKF